MIRNHLRVLSEKLDTDIFKLWQFYYFGWFQYWNGGAKIKAFCDN